MAEECEFYYYDRDYCCRLLKNSDRDYVVNSDWVRRYCWGYNYSECPYYKNKSDMSSSSGGCYLTSACVQSKGLTDDCSELRILRMFRDEYVRHTPMGNREIEHYYQVAPQIVDIINRRSDASEIWDRIYNELIYPCVKYIEAGQYSTALDMYRAYSMQLENKYI